MFSVFSRDIGCSGVLSSAMEYAVFLKNTAYTVWGIKDTEVSSSFTENVDSGWIVVVENLFDANLRIVSASNIFSQRGRDPRRGDEDTIVSSSFILHIGTNPEYLSAIVSSHMRRWTTARAAKEN